MSKKMKIMMIALGVSAILVLSFATVAMAAGPAGYGNGTGDCIQQEDCLQDCDGPIADQLQDRTQQRDRLQDCDPTVDPIQDRIQQRDQLKDCVS
jgi:hypothetical protein